jgi:hypothetical protein
VRRGLVWGCEREGGRSRWMMVMMMMMEVKGMMI